MVRQLPLRIVDGGRPATAGARRADCVTRAIATATGRSYAEIEALINEAARRERPGAMRQTRSGRAPRRSSAASGVFKQTTRRVLESLGWRFVPTMAIGSGCRVHLREGELPAGRLIVQLSRHLCAVIDGVVYDNHDPRRGGDRCVYGYWENGQG